MSVVLVIYISLFPVPVESFTSEKECVAMAVKVNEYLQKNNKEGKAWCEIRDMKI